MKNLLKNLLICTSIAILAACGSQDSAVYDTTVRHFSVEVPNIPYVTTAYTIISSGAIVKRV